MVDSVDLLRQLVAIPSVFPNEKKIGDFLAEQLKQRGFRVKKQVFSRKPRRFNVVGEKGRGKKSVLLYGHMDTVPVYEGWTTDPFTLVEDGDKLVGRGALDMKAGCAAFLKAVEGFEPKGFKVKLVFGADEENISEGAHALAASGVLKDVVVVLVSEPAIGTTEHHGPRTLTLGRRGRCDVVITVKGESAHGAYGIGINAVEEASKIVLALKQLPLAEHEIGKGSLFCRKISADSGSLSVPEVCEILVDRHLVPPETPESAVVQIQHLLQDLKTSGMLKGEAVAALKPRKTPFLKPYATEKSHAFTQFIEWCVKEVFGEVYYQYGFSVADDNIFGADLNLPVITIGPKGQGCHGAGEYVLRSSYEELIRIYVHILEQFNKKSGTLGSFLV